jgi:hypothetical protein
MVGAAPMGPGLRGINGIGQVAVGVWQKAPVIQDGCGEGENGVIRHDPGAPTGHEGPGQGWRGRREKNVPILPDLSRRFNKDSTVDLPASLNQKKI